jgi:hypothetical protein
MHEQITATYYYPGSFFAEDISLNIPEPSLAAATEARRDSGWFAVQITRTPLKAFRAADGEERLLPDSKPVKIGKWYIGEEFTIDEVAALGDGHHTILSNMRHNGWTAVCRTRRGNWQPIEEGDVVLAGTPAMA